MGKVMRSLALSCTAAAAVLTIGASNAYAQWGRGSFGGGGGGGAHSMTFGISLLASNQKDLNAVIDDHGDTVGSNYKVDEIGSGYEFIAQYAYRFDRTMYSLVIRPSYVTQSTDGACGSVNCKYELSGFTLFPMLRLTPLENDFIKFYMQLGMGYGQLSTSVKQGSNSAKFSGSGFGTSIGVGTNFCFTTDHCLTVEGNLRYLSFERNVADSVSGTFAAGSGFSQLEDGDEVEKGNRDLATTLSGIQGIIAYTMNF